MEEQLEIRTQLLNNCITYKEALERIKRLPKAWHTKHWKEMREKHLKDKCENCGSADPPLVIQHTKQPKKFSEWYWKVMDLHVNFKRIESEVSERQITDEEIEECLRQNSEIRGSCPECATINIRKNNKKNIFICAKQHYFETPFDVLYYSRWRTTDNEKAKQSAIKTTRYTAAHKEARELKEKYDLEVGKEALLLSIEESIEYRSFKYIKTCCKRCAAIEDKIVPKYILCEECRENYHNPMYRTCYHCYEKASGLE